MTLTVLLSLALFAFVSSITPGPNNVMLTASGATFGYRRTLPHMLGISAGVALMLLLVGAGLGTVFEAMPMLYTALKYAGAAYLLYLAWRIARAGGVDGAAARSKPFTFLEAAAFQWVNPKAWIMAVGIVATYTPQEGFFRNLIVATLVLSMVNFPSISVWTLFGSALRRLLRQPRSVQRFNIGMALLLVTSLYPIVLEYFAG
ncbi:LysE family translocator [Pollutimonas bauzanensis]|uniref:Threonine/homoserine/homoserine lactone efflux protein n=1 Tax=Pollutimonas bauzanensis TaxID=658167 RepID=A0A1M5MAJ8_9BURK|nr:Threonine/homoserine/homoserine lactone efflux protein [Pollutimonas bauzanensis]